MSRFNVIFLCLYGLAFDRHWNFSIKPYDIVLGFGSYNLGLTFDHYLQEHLDLILAKSARYKRYWTVLMRSDAKILDESTRQRVEFERRFIASFLERFLALLYWNFATPGEGLKTDLLIVSLIFQINISKL